MIFIVGSQLFLVKFFYSQTNMKIF